MVSDQLFTSNTKHMRKIILFLLVACSTIAFGNNKVSGKITGDKGQRSNLLLNRLGSDSGKHFNFSKDKMAQNGEKKLEMKNLSEKVFLQSYVQRTEEKATKRLDSLIAKDINGKIFAKEIFFYYPYGTYPAGALRANELWDLDEDENKWHGFRMSAIYDEFGNAEIRLIEVTDGEGKWVPESKYTAKYTAREGDLLLDMIEVYQDGEWVGDYKRTNTYDAQGRILTTNTFVWNESLKAWDDFEKGETTYEAGKATELGYAFSNGMWVSTTKMVTITDANGNITRMENYQWSNEKNDWSMDLKVENTYNDDGNLTLALNYNYDEKLGELLPNAKEAHTYNGNMIAVEYFNYNNKSGDWEGVSKTEEKYENDLVVENYFYNWASSTKTWINDTKGVHVYNNQGSPTLTNNYVWDGTKWQDDSKVEIEYNEYGFEKHNVSYLYDLATSSWIKNSELFEETDSEGRILLLEPYLLNEDGVWGGVGSKEVYVLDENGKSIRDEFSFWDFDKEEWVIDEIDDYFYTLITSDIQESKKDVTEIAVLCVDGNLVISNAVNERIDVYTASGSLIYKANVTKQNESISMDNGFYIVRVGGHSFKINVR